MRSLRRDLFERRLWPLAIAIVVAIVAVPFVLHSHRASAQIAPPPAVKGGPSPSSTAHHARATHPRATPVSHQRDPFEASITPRAVSSSSTTSTTSTSTSTTSGSAPASAGATSGGSVSSAASSAGGASSSASPTTSAPTTPAPATPGVTTPVRTPVTTAPGRTSDGGFTQTRSWDIYSVDLRIGVPGAPAAHRDIAHRDIARLTPLPSERSPQVMYMGVADHGRNAVFALGAGVEVRAAGQRSAGALCKPSRVDCALLVMPAGKSVELSYVNSTGAVRRLVLRLTRIADHVTRSSSTVKTARRHVSAVGLCDLKLGDPIGFFDPADDSVKVPSTASCRHHKLAVPFPGSLGAGSSVRG